MIWNGKGCRTEVKDDEDEEGGENSCFHKKRLYVLYTHVLSYEHTCNPYELDCNLGIHKWRCDIEVYYDCMDGGKDNMHNRKS